MMRVNATGVSLLHRPGYGTRMPLVLLHGIGSNAQSWALTLARLDPAVNAYAWDAPGYGLSDPFDVAAPAPEDYAARLEQVLDTLGLGRIVLVGHSLGALFACRFAASRPARVAALTLLSPALGYKVAPGEALPAKVQARIDDLDRLGPMEFAQNRAGNLLFRPETKPELLASAQAAMAAVHPAGYAQAVHALGSGDLLGDAARVEAVSAVGTGAEDTVTPPANAAAVHAALRCQIPVMTVPDAGHALPLEAPAQVAALLGRMVLGATHG